MPLKAFFLLETCLIVCEVPYLSLLVFGEHSLLSVVFRIYFFFLLLLSLYLLVGKCIRLLISENTEISKDFG